MRRFSPSPLLAIFSICFATVGLPCFAWAHGALDERIRELKIALASAPHDAELHFALADAYCQHEEWSNALAQLDEAERRAPGRFMIDLVRGRALLGSRRPREAREALDRFLGGHPAHAPALMVRARAHRALGETAGALDDYRAAWRAAAAPDADLVQEIADALASHGHGDEAMQIVNAALAQLGPVPSLLTRAVELEAGRERFDAALEHVAALERSAARPELWMAKRAELLARAGRTGEARDAWRALRDHLAALPNLERGLPAMRALAQRVDAALRSLDHLSPSASSASSTLPASRP